jgi:hypothetical protein
MENLEKEQTPMRSEVADLVQDNLADEPTHNAPSSKSYVIGAVLTLLVCVPVIVGLAWKLYAEPNRAAMAEQGFKKVMAIRLDWIIDEKEKSFVEQTKSIDLNDKTQTMLALEQIKQIRQTIETQLDQWQQECQCVLLNPRGVYRDRMAIEDHTQRFMDELNQRLVKTQSTPIGVNHE